MLGSVGDHRKTTATCNGVGKRAGDRNKGAQVTPLDNKSNLLWDTSKRFKCSDPGTLSCSLYAVGFEMSKSWRMFSPSDSFIIAGSLFDPFVPGQKMRVSIQRIQHDIQSPDIWYPSDIGQRKRVRVLMLCCAASARSIHLRMSRLPLSLAGFNRGSEK